MLSPRQHTVTERGPVQDSPVVDKSALVRISIIFGLSALEAPRRHFECGLHCGRLLPDNISLNILSS